MTRTWYFGSYREIEPIAAAACACASGEPLMSRPTSCTRPPPRTMSSACSLACSARECSAAAERSLTSIVPYLIVSMSPSMSLSTVPPAEAMAPSEMRGASAEAILSCARSPSPTVRPRPITPRLFLWPLYVSTDDPRAEAMAVGAVDARLAHALLRSGETRAVRWLRGLHGLLQARRPLWLP